MVGIQGIGGVPEPKPDHPANVRDSKQGAPADEASSSSDDVVTSQSLAPTKPQERTRDSSRVNTAPNPDPWYFQARSGSSWVTSHKFTPP